MVIEDYDIYCFSKKEIALCMIQEAGLCLMVSYLFYQNFYVAILGLPYLYFFLKNQRKIKAKKRKEQLNYEFLDGIHSISVALEAGYSMENAFRIAYKDLSMMYLKDALIMREFQHIIAMINMNASMEEAITQFARRCKLEDIECFSEVFATAKRTGGDLVSIIKMTGKTINEKVEVMREIVTLITAKKLEVTIMKCVPFGIIFYLHLCNAEFLRPLYHNLGGSLFMTVLLGSYLMLTKLADHIVDISV